MAFHSMTQIHKLYTNLYNINCELSNFLAPTGNCISSLITVYSAHGSQKFTVLSAFYQPSCPGHALMFYSSNHHA